MKATPGSPHRAQAQRTLSQHPRGNPAVAPGQPGARLIQRLHSCATLKQRLGPCPRQSLQTVPTDDPSIQSTAPDPDLSGVLPVPSLQTTPFTAGHDSVQQDVQRKREEGSPQRLPNGGEILSSNVPVCSCPLRSPHPWLKPPTAPADKLGESSHASAPLTVTPENRVLGTHAAAYSSVRCGQTLVKLAPDPAV